MFESINTNVCKKNEFTSEEIEYFNTILQYKEVPKKTLLLQEGDICNFEAYILKGCIRKYYINENGFEVIVQFAVEDWWISDIASFHEKKPSKLFIETLEDCQLLILTPETKEMLLSTVPKFERIFRLLIQRNLSAMQNRLIDTIAKSAQEKYLEFIKLYPTIPQRVAQHYIASYLGISAEFLSKVRTKLAKQ
ncbi:Crp/Fnr family transcriptional regulator [Flavobacterium granuli]|uniref:CRP-like cAMP-binding protein n=1 Tax=Flavobacterium granuli TaxID=280093 RepID=A0ABU1S3V3_9FLAO|nr:Crp/Fnr family transcriptional regulator [Flavobacterium granuli]MDR6845707.1 CRP-like cAMP-binding protein [Flavobacterium granuli]